MNESSVIIQKSSQWKLAAILGLFSAIGPLSIDMYLPSLPKLAADLHSTTSVAQMTLTACLLGIATGQIVVGPLSDQRGRRIPLVVAISIYAVSSLLCSVANSIWLLIFLRFIQGASGAGGIVISRAIARDLHSGAELTKFFSLLMLVNGAAPILAPIFGGFLLTVTSWRGVFVVLCGLGIIMVLSAFFNITESLPEERRKKGGLQTTLSTYKLLLKDRLFMGFALTQGFVYAGMFAYISGSPFVIQNIYGASPQQFSLFFALNGAGLIVFSQITGRLAGRIPEKRMQTIGLLIGFTGSLCLLVTIILKAPLIGIIIPLFFAISSLGMINTATVSLAMQNQRETAGSASALLGLLPFLLGACVAPLVGIAGEETAIPMGIIIAVCYSIALYCGVWLTREKKSKVDVEQNSQTY